LWHMPGVYGQYGSYLWQTGQGYADNRTIFIHYVRSFRQGSPGRRRPLARPEPPVAGLSARSALAGQPRRGRCAGRSESPGRGPYPPVACAARSNCPCGDALDVLSVASTPPDVPWGKRAPMGALPLLVVRPISARKSWDRSFRPSRPTQDRTGKRNRL
jgi:hypothetical protein